MNKYQILPPLNNEYDFEELMVDLFNERYITDEFSLFGRRGQNQKGIDILGNKNSDIVLQCKKKDISISDSDAQRLLKEDINKDINKAKKLEFTFKRIIFASTYKDDSIIQEYCRKLSENELFEIEYWGWGKITKQLESCLNVLKKYYPDFFLILSKREYNLPSENHLFTGRKKELEKILNDLNKSNVIVLKGLGGRGKTQIAKRVLYLYKNDYSVKCWINANNIEELNNEYHRIAKFFGIGNVQSNNDIDVTIEEVKHFFNNSNNNLLIFDNADNIELEELKRYLPGTNSKVIITTQNSTWDTGNYTESKIGDLEFADAKEFVLSHTQNRKSTSDDDKDCKILIKMLKLFPLALEHARAYINIRKISIKEYINLYKENNVLIMNNKLSDYHKTVLTTWKISFNKASEISEKCFPFLGRCSFLFSSNIPIKELFLDTTLYSRLELDEVIDALMSYSLIDLDNNYIFMHGIVQEVVRQELIDRKEYPEYLYDILQIILKVLPLTITDENDKNTSELLIPHAINVLTFVDDNAKDLRLGFEIAQCIGYTFYAFGNFKESIIFINKQLLMVEILNDLDSHVDTLNSLGLAYHYIGKSDQALNVLKKALIILENPKNIFKEHIKDILKCEIFGNMGIVFKDRDDLNRSLEYFRNALRLAEKYKIKSVIVDQLCNIGNIYKHKKDFDGALSKFEIALELSKELEDRKRELKQLGNIGAIYVEKSNFQLAKDYFIINLKICKELGDKKIEAITLDYLGTCCLNLGDVENAYKNFNEALNTSKQIDFKQGEVNTLINLSIYYYYIKNASMGVEYKRNSLRLAKEIGYQRAIEYINRMN